MNDLVAWLESWGLSQFAQAFSAHRLDLDILQDLNERDLEVLGVCAMGDRKRLLRAIAALRGSASSNSAAPAPNPKLACVSSPAGEFEERPTERRQLSVAFCDLVNSTELATALDPEDFRHTLRSFHDAVTGAVSAHGGYVAQLLGDGVLVYFGYPYAQEDDASRAVHAALDAIVAVSNLTIGTDRPLKTRIGIATGLVVVGRIGDGTPAAELSASGETPNLAARLQGQAAPGRVVVSELTRTLTEGEFEFESLGAVALKGFRTLVQAWQVTGERHAPSRFDATHRDNLSKFIGREGEVAVLLNRWETACEGEGQAVLLTGEAGIGKSRITQVFRQRARKLNGVVVLQCSPAHRNSSLYPVVRALEMASHLQASQSSSEREARIVRYLTRRGALPDHSSLPFLLRLLIPGEDGSVAESEESPAQQKKRVLQTLTEIVRALTAKAPVLLLVEDAHWIDPTTEEWIAKAIDQLRDARLLTVITARPEYESAWAGSLEITRVSINRLSRRQTEEMIACIPGSDALAREAVNEIVDKTDGMPLFIEELTKTVLSLKEPIESATASLPRNFLQALTIPATLQDSLMARLDRLGRAKEVAQVAAAIGRDFSHALLAKVMGISETVLDDALDSLQRVEIVFERGLKPDQRYSFKHALIRDIAYDSLVKSYRVALHGVIARAIEDTLPTLAMAQPEVLAYHHQEACHFSEAARYLEVAGDLAWSRSAGQEANSHYSRALAIASRLPCDVERREAQLRLHLKLGSALSATEGYGSHSTYDCFERARGLARELGRIADYVNAWTSSAPTLFGAGRAREAIESMNDIAVAQLDSLPAGLRVATLTNLGVAHFLLADAARAWEYLEAAKALDDEVQVTHLHPVGGGDPAVALRAYATRCCAFQGRLDEAETVAAESLNLATKRGHLPSIAWALQMAIVMKLLKAEYLVAESMATELVELSERLGFKTRVATGWILLGRASVALDRVDKGTDLLRRGCDLWALAGGKFHLTEYKAQAADSLIRAGRVDQARSFLDEAKAVQASTDERYYEAELIRLSGRFMEIDGNASASEAAYRQAIDTAKAKGLHLLQLRAACDWLRLTGQDGSSHVALNTVQDIYASVSGDDAYTDIQHAKELLRSLKRDP